jgi:hypothetical protein
MSPGEIRQMSNPMKSSCHKVKTIRIAMILVFMIFAWNMLISTCFARGITPEMYLVNATNRDYSSITAMFTSVGFNVTQGDISHCLEGSRSDSVLILPNEEANYLNHDQVELILNKIKSGSNLISYGSSLLSRSLGIKTGGEEAAISGYRWNQHPEVLIKFPKPVVADSIARSKRMKVLGAAVQTNRPVAVSGRLGEGRFIYCGIPLAPADGNGYEHFPFLLEAVRDEFHIKPVLSRKDLSVYLDLAYHRGATPGELIRKLKAWGINRVHCSSWYAASEARKFMREFISTAHRNGIAVYAWLEFPMVGRHFWDQHPECREQTAAGKDAKVDWRYHIALEDRRCFDLVAADLEKLIMDLDWDGIDIAELYFESPLGFPAPQNFTPMHSSFRSSFRNSHGIDPKEIFNPGSAAYWQQNPALKQALIDERIALIGQLNGLLLEFCEHLRVKKPHLRIVMTVIDTITDGPMKEHIGVDAEYFVQLQKQYGFDLEIEDPYTLWNLGPKRYQLIGDRYRSRISSDHALSIDINIVERQGAVYPTSKQRGLELLQLIHSAATHADRVILYGLSTLEPADMVFAKYAHGQDIRVEDQGKGSVKCTSRKKFFLETESGSRQYFLDGKPWPCYADDAVIVPAGEHSLQVQADAQRQEAASLRVEDISAEILSAVRNGQGLVLEYTSEGRATLVLNRAFSSLQLDGLDASSVPQRVGTKVVLTLPQGRHQVRLE